MGLALLCVLGAANPLSVAATMSAPTVTGTVAIDVADGFASRRTARYAMLETGAERIPLAGVDPSSVQPGQRVTLRGDSEVVALGSSAFDEPTDPAPAKPKRVAVLMVNFRQAAGMPAPVEPWTRTFVDELFFSGSRSVAAYYSELSDGQLSIRAMSLATSRSPEAPTNATTTPGATPPGGPLLLPGSICTPTRTSYTRSRAKRAAGGRACPPFAAATTGSTAS